MAKSLLLLDFSSLIHKAAHVNSHLSHRNLPTGALYGCLQQIASVVNQVKPTKTVVCLDAKPYFRSTVFTEYKQGRQGKMDEWLGASIAIGKKHGLRFLQEAGVPCLGVVGFEADDLIAILSRNEGAAFDEVVVSSGDSDLYQCLNDKFYLLKGGGPRGTRKPYTKAMFDNDYPGLGTHNWALVQAITGGHNGLVGISGVGEKTAINYILDREACLKTKRGKDIEDQWDRVMFNLPLCTLPPDELVHGTDLIGIPPCPKVGEVTRKLTVLLKEFGIEYSSFIESAVNRINR